MKTNLFSGLRKFLLNKLLGGKVSSGLQYTGRFIETDGNGKTRTQERFTLEIPYHAESDSNHTDKNNKGKK